MRSYLKLVIVLILTACGGKQNSTASNVQPRPETQAPEPPPPVPVRQGLEFVGTWSIQGRDMLTGRMITQTAQISENGASFLVNFQSGGGAGIGLVGTHPATYERGILHTNSQLGDIGYDSSRNVILIGGHAFSRISAPAVSAGGEGSNAVIIEGEGD